MSSLLSFIQLSPDIFPTTSMLNRRLKKQEVTPAAMMIIFLCLPFLVNSMAIQSKVLITSVELTENVLPESQQNSDIEDTDEGQDAFFPSTNSFPLFSTPRSDDLEEFPLEDVEINIPAQDDENETKSTYSPSSQSSSQETELTSTNSNQFNVFEIYNSEHNMSIVFWNCTEMGESTSTSEACVVKKDTVVGNVFQRAEPLFKTMIANANVDDSKITVFIAGTTRDDVVDWINSETQKKAESMVDEDGNIPKIRRVKNVTLAIAFTLNLEDAVDEEEDEVVEYNLANKEEDEDKEDTLRPQLDQVEVMEDDNQEQEEDGGSLRQSDEDLPTWTAEEIMDMQRW